MKNKELNLTTIFEARRKLWVYVAFMLLLLGGIGMAQAQEEEGATESGSPGRLLTRANVNVRETPSTTAPVIAQLPSSTEYEFTEIGAGEAIQLNATWYAISLPDGEQGWAWDGAVTILKYPTELTPEPLSDDERTALIEQGYVGFDRAEFGPTLPVEASEIEPYLFRGHEMPLTPDLFAEYPNEELTNIFQVRIKDGIGIVPTVWGKQDYTQMGVYPAPDINGNVAKFIPVTDFLWARTPGSSTQRSHAGSWGNSLCAYIVYRISRTSFYL